MLLPKTSPAANSGSLTNKIEVAPVPNSGREVAVARSNTPTKACPKFSSCEITSTLETK